MNQHHLNTIVLALSLAFSGGAMAQNLSKADYKTGKDKISAEYKAAKAACDALAGNAEDICMAKAPPLGDSLRAAPEDHLAACHMVHPGSGHSKAPATLAELFNI